MVKFNASIKKPKLNRPAKKTNHSGAKPNKAKPSYDTSFMKGRYRWALACIVVCLLSLITRAAYVQVIDAEQLMSEADKRSLRTQKIPAFRGSILDRNGHLLSVSVPMYSVYVDPKDALAKNSLEETERWQALAEAINVPYKTLIQRVKRNPNSRFIYLTRQVSPTVAQYVRELKIKGIQIETEPRRFYPRVEEVAHLIGYTNIDGEGIEGIEKSFNSLLIGQEGSRTYRKDRYGNIVENIENVKKFDANDVVLSIDEKLQSMVYREIKKAVAENKAESGTAVLVDIRTGEILAMANAPSYNPNNREGSKAEFRRNRAITDTFEPGSTVKPFVVLTALQRGVANKNTIIDTTPFKVDGKTITDVAKRNSQDLESILKNSSNIGVSKLALKMPPTALVETYNNAGFGERTNLGLEGESSGVFPKNRKRWSNIDRASFSYGYGLTVTPLQLARAYATLGSFGIARPLSITKVDPPIIGNRVFSEKITRDVVKMMESVAAPDGGGRAAAVEGYRVAIKTGTAKKTENGRYVDKYLAYTAGVAPASDPRYALVVMIDDPKAGKYYGGAISAPLFSRIMGYTLRANNIAPDNLSSEQVAKRTVRLNQTSKSDNESKNN
ncbi:peptidoglycan synthetase FtsI [Volucribacter psittacicida]|uniref:Peptidoglycan D,D-transpeptidase FtsI n=1 Tax=Volucribacter psittacicida TaxID=203482 RepID=A0A4R1G2H3_9PAST|nr:peptidoglycan glycosyltransferase FtsI [Volucribacter psittacicida]TCJ97881.1 peptidoglycan synthetase FtsI [Volucribacter psittacicida]